MGAALQDVADSDLLFALLLSDTKAHLLFSLNIFHDDTNLYNLIFTGVVKGHFSTYFIIILQLQWV